MSNEKIQDMVLKLIDLVSVMQQPQLESLEIQEQSDMVDQSKQDNTKYDVMQLMIDQINLKSDLHELSMRLKDVEAKMERRYKELIELIQDKNV